MLEQNLHDVDVDGGDDNADAECEDADADDDRDGRADHACCCAHPTQNEVCAA